MARLNISPVMVILLLGSVAITILPGLAVPASSPAPAQQHLLECANKLGDCGKQVYFAVFVNGTTVTKDCCTRLLSVGKQCHHDLIVYATQRPTFKGNVSEILDKSEQVWNGCIHSTPASLFH
ncbi:protein DOWN-REGULATED IN DIF1 11 [Ziziphus jujuba]|uniref:Protein DOWN-REGULATED IN DIF1 11 n=1 Tax=Ziziphus jujuba TaxID=326968 RepID=A0ABM3I6P1_ZIZJJ|nr:protein DOWN-REGULATED IN DIF1 11 [Ziziphus jujuba]